MTKETDNISLEPRFTESDLYRNYKDKFKHNKNIFVWKIPKKKLSKFKKVVFPVNKSGEKIYVLADNSTKDCINGAIITDEHFYVINQAKSGDSKSIAWEKIESLDICHEDHNWLEINENKFFEFRSTTNSFDKYHFIKIIRSIIRGKTSIYIKNSPNLKKTFEEMIIKSAGLVRFFGIINLIYSVIIWSAGQAVSVPAGAWQRQAILGIILLLLDFFVRNFRKSLELALGSLILCLIMLFINCIVLVGAFSKDIYFIVSIFAAFFFLFGFIWIGAKSIFLLRRNDL